MSLVLDGFAYRQLAAPAPASSGFRIEWLAQQEPAHMGLDFRPQPWHQLIRVFQRMGLPAAARDVAVAHEVQLRAPAVSARDPPLPPALAAALGTPRVRAGGRLWPPAVATGGGDGCGVAWLRGACSTSRPNAAPWRRRLPWQIAETACAAVRGQRRARPSTGRDAQTLPPQYPAFNPLALFARASVPFVDLQQRRLWSVAGERAAPEGSWATAARIAPGTRPCWAGSAGCWSRCADGAVNRRRASTERILTPS